MVFFFLCRYTKWSLLYHTATLSPRVHCHLRILANLLSFFLSWFLLPSASPSPSPPTEEAGRKIFSRSCAKNARRPEIMQLTVQREGDLKKCSPQGQTNLAACVQAVGYQKKLCLRKKNCIYVQLSKSSNDDCTNGRLLCHKILYLSPGQKLPYTTLGRWLQTLLPNTVCISEIYCTLHQCHSRSSDFTIKQASNKSRWTSWLLLFVWERGRRNRRRWWWDWMERERKKNSSGYLFCFQERQTENFSEIFAEMIVLLLRASSPPVWQ